MRSVFVLQAKTAKGISYTASVETIVIQGGAEVTRVRVWNTCRTFEASGDGINLVFGRADSKDNTDELTRLFNKLGIELDSAISSAVLLKAQIKF